MEDPQNPQNPEIHNPENQPEIIQPIQNPIPVINPGNQVLTIRLTDSNYLLWRQQVSAAVRGHGLTGFLTRTTTNPPEMYNGQLNPDFDSWERQDQFLASWLLASISEAVLVTTVGLNSSAEIWSAFDQAFAGQSRAKILQYKLQVQNMKKGQMRTRDYLSKMK